MNESLKAMVEAFQCPGCVLGSNTQCGSFKIGHQACSAWVPGTIIMPIVGKIALGLPKGFCRTGQYDKQQFWIRLYPASGAARGPGWDKFNIATWAMIVDGYLFVRTYVPRLSVTYVDVIEGGTEIPPGAIDVGTFIDSID